MGRRVSLSSRLATSALSLLVALGATACSGCDDESLSGPRVCAADEDCAGAGRCVADRCVEDDVGGDTDTGAFDGGDDSGLDAQDDADAPLVCGDEESACAGVCCTAAQVCLGEACVDTRGECERTEECALDEICEPSIGQCLPRDQVAVCEYRPPVGELEPLPGCTWVPDGLEYENRGDVVAVPVVANLSDDNGDGVTDTDDIPDIVFPSFNRNSQGCCNVDATVRVVEGRCAEDGTMRTIASISEPPINNDSGLALADLDGDGVAEIIGVTRNAAGRPQGTVAFRRISDDASQWEPMWHNEDYPTWDVHTRGGANTSVADLDADGQPEVIIGNVVLNGQSGALKWDGVVTSADHAGGPGGIGNNAFLGPASTVADVTLDGTQEVIAGNTLYNHRGEVLWTYAFTSQNSRCQGPLTCDGFNAVARFNEGDHPNIVLVRRGEIIVLDHQGQEVWKIGVPLDNCTNGNEAGPPTIADFDGDGIPEIGTAGADFYVVAKRECDVDNWQDLNCSDRGILWKTTNQDCSSRATASSVFDFEGDGKAEVVYADEQDFYILDGTTGEVLFEDGQHESNTRIEMPVIADVDNDGAAEVLVASAYGNRGDRPGLWVWKDARNNWVRTRRIWNQHAYSVTNITEDARVPRIPERNWENGRLNNFRQNVQPDGLFDAPDLVVEEVTTNQVSCGVEGELRISVVVGNQGARSVPEGTPVWVKLARNSTVLLDERLELSEALLPGNTERFELSLEVPNALVQAEFALSVEADPDNRYNECNEDNNAQLVEGVQCRILG